MNKEIYIGDINYNTSYSSNGSQYPYGLIMFGRYHKQCEDKLTGVKLIIDNKTEEGILLTKMLKEKTDIDILEEFIFNLVIKYKSISEIRWCLNEQIKQNYEKGIYDGRQSKIKEIRRILEI